jgi:hypothetical protein
MPGFQTGGAVFSLQVRCGTSTVALSLSRESEADKKGTAKEKEAHM